MKARSLQTAMVSIEIVRRDCEAVINELIRLRSLTHRGEQVFGIDFERAIGLVPKYLLPDHERKRAEAISDDPEATR